MPIGDKIDAAKKIGEFLQTSVRNSGLRLKYRITVDPPLPENTRLGAPGDPGRVCRS